MDSIITYYNSNQHPLTRCLLLLLLLLLLLCFLNTDFITVLNVPADSIDTIEVKLDESSVDPPLTIIYFVLVNKGRDGSVIDPIAKAQELKDLVDNNSPQLAATQNLSGMRVLNVDTTTGEKEEKGSGSALVIIVAIVVSKLITL